MLQVCLLCGCRSIQLSSGVLHLLNVASSDVGTYSCHASIFGREADSHVAELSIESGRHK